jgi:hypothetical protein
MTLDENTVEAFVFDRAALRAVADGICVGLAEILTPPVQNPLLRKRHPLAAGDHVLAPIAVGQRWS